MKKITAVLLAFLITVSGIYGQASNLTEFEPEVKVESESKPESGIETEAGNETVINVRYYQKKNLFPGFGLGSKAQGDTTSYRWLMASDITGITLMAGGTVSLVLSCIIYDGLRMMYGNVTTADMWLSGSALTAGVLLFAGGRTAGWFLPVKYEEKKLSAVPVVSFTGKSLTAGVAMSF